jgi:hypothetical protein
MLVAVLMKLVISGINVPPRCNICVSPLPSRLVVAVFPAIGIVYYNALVSTLLEFP